VPRSDWVPRAAYSCRTCRTHIKHSPRCLAIRSAANLGLKKPPLSCHLAMAARVPSCCVLHPVELCVGHRAIRRVSEPHKLHSVPILTVAAPPFLVPGLNSRCGVRCHPRSQSPHRHGPVPSLHHHPDVMTADNTCPNGTIPLTPVAENRARAPSGSTVYLTVGLAVTLDVPGAC
jgi:hypothetical protein